MYKRRFGRVLPLLGMAVVVLFISSTAGVSQPPRGKSSTQDAVLVLTVVERGIIQGAHDLNISSNLKVPATITSIVDEGTVVRKGDVVATLNDREFRRELEDAETQAVQVKASLDSAKAEVNALRDRKESVGQLHTLRRQTATERIRVAEAAATASKTRMELLEQQLQEIQQLETLLDVPAGGNPGRELIETRLRKTSIQLQIAELSVPTASKDIAEATLAAEEVRQMNRTEEQQIAAQLRAAEANVELETLQLAAAESRVAAATQALEHCTIRAPRDGLVLHASVSSSRGAEPFVPAAGSQIRPTQILLKMPDLDEFQVVGRLNESKWSRVQVGQDVSIEIDALPGVLLKGQVKSIADVATPGSWPDTDLRTAEFIVSIDPQSLEATNIRPKPGLTCSLRIDVR
ncbi:MAG: efflux RND transporter periplasmic adaptor subunit [Planctomycetaceae bacterium]|nr:efflux RND transporter periplasmic adaptor subunit [Planctomycetaceae bacterium]